MTAQPADDATAPETVRCAWCDTELAPEDAKPVKYARLSELPDSENMQCADHDACLERSRALDAHVANLNRRAS